MYILTKKSTKKNLCLQFISLRSIIISVKDSADGDTVEMVFDNCIVRLNRDSKSRRKSGKFAEILEQYHTKQKAPTKIFT